MEAKLQIVNENEMYQQEELNVGGAWACVIGCGTFCIMGGGIASYIAAAASAL